MAQHSTGYTIMFAAGICLVCSVFVSGAAVSLKDRQEANKVLDRQKKVLVVAGLMEEGESLPPEEVQDRFNNKIAARLVSLDSGTFVDSAANGANADAYDQRKASKDPDLSTKAVANNAKVSRIPNVATVYLVLEGEKVDQHILPIQGAGLWSTLYGYLSVASDGNTIRGITFYEHAETPGLGGEVDNAGWKAKWKDRKVFDGKGEIAIHVKKGAAGDAASDPYAVDGLSGATLTSNGVTNSIEFWLGGEAFGPYLSKVKSGKVKG
jgi:Na+-transporting NADH:ubiquinone oxidoreductase subunit C